MAYYAKVPIRVIIKPFAPVPAASRSIEISESSVSAEVEITGCVPASSDVLSPWSIVIFVLRIGEPF